MSSLAAQNARAQLEGYQDAQYDCGGTHNEAAHAENENFRRPCERVITLGARSCATAYAINHAEENNGRGHRACQNRVSAPTE